MKSIIFLSLFLILTQTQIIKEYHFHVYFHQHNTKELELMKELQQKIITAVGNGQFVGVMDGITSKELPKLKKAHYPINYEPRGPHPMGSYEVWVPQENFAEAMSFFIEQRGDLSVLIHPLSDDEYKDHTHSPMWLGPSSVLDLSAFDPNPHSPENEGEYPELGLGYSANTTITSKENESESNLRLERFI